MLRADVVEAAAPGVPRLAGRDRRRGDRAADRRAGRSAADAAGQFPRARSTGASTSGWRRSPRRRAASAAAPRRTTTAKAAGAPKRPPRAARAVPRAAQRVTPSARLRRTELGRCGCGLTPSGRRSRRRADDRLVDERPEASVQVRAARRQQLRHQQRHELLLRDPPSTSCGRRRPSRRRPRCRSGRCGPGPPPRRSRGRSPCRRRRARARRRACRRGSTVISSTVFGLSSRTPSSSPPFSSICRKRP